MASGSQPKTMVNLHQSEEHNFPFWKSVGHRTATLCGISSIFLHHSQHSKTMNLCEICLSLHVGVYVCVVEFMITITQVQMSTCL